MDEREIIILTGRQTGLDRQIEIAGFSPKVYDKRISIPLLKLKRGIEKFEDIWFTENYDSLPLVGMDASIVSGYFNNGKFRYSCQGSRESDPEYVVLKTQDNGAERIAERLQEMGSENILIGKELNKLQTLSYTSLLRDTQVNVDVREIMALPKEEQERRIRELVKYKQVQELK